MALGFCALGSGSRGNAVLVKNEDTTVLIDCGFPIKQLGERLESVGESIDGIDCVVITHEHGDHIKSVGELSESGLPIYGHEMTLREIKKKLRSKPLFYSNPLPTANAFQKLVPFTVGSIQITPFHTPHDAVCPLGYRFEDSEGAAVYATDIGFVSEEILNATKGAELIMLESNYDFEMLVNGRYPRFLKERILSERGHLCNGDCARAIIKMLDKGTTRFILGHVSEENNLPELVYETSVCALNAAGAVANRDFYLTVASQYEPVALKVAKL